MIFTHLSPSVHLPAGSFEFTRPEARIADGLSATRKLAHTFGGWLLPCRLVASYLPVPGIRRRC